MNDPVVTLRQRNAITSTEKTLHDEIEGLAGEFLFLFANTDPRLSFVRAAIESAVSYMELARTQLTYLREVLTQYDRDATDGEGKGVGTEDRGKDGHGLSDR